MTGEPRRRPPLGWRIADATFFVMFAFGVVVQINDPDPLRWVVVYGLAAAGCIGSLRGSLRPFLPIAVGALSLLWALSLAPRVLGRVPFADMFGAFEMKNVGIEESREMYGLLLIAGWMAVLAWRWRPGLATTNRETA